MSRSRLDPGGGIRGALRAARPVSIRVSGSQVSLLTTQGEKKQAEKDVESASISGAHGAQGLAQRPSTDLIILLAMGYEPTT